MLQDARSVDGVDDIALGAGDVSLPLPAAATGEIVFAEEYPVGTNHWRIWLMADNGEGPVMLTGNDAERTAPKLSPDGSKIAFQRRQGGVYSVATMNVDGTGESVLPGFPGSTDNEAPSWSPDGTKLAFMSRVSGSYDIVITNADGTNPVALTSGSSVDSQPVWSADGTKIYFISNRDDVPFTDVYRMNANGSSVTRLTTTPNVTESGPAVSPRRRHEAPLTRTAPMSSSRTPTARARRRSPAA